MRDIKKPVEAKREVAYQEKGIVEFILSEEEKKFIKEQLNYQNYQNPKIKVTYIYVSDEDRFYGVVKKYNIKGEEDTIFLTKEEIMDNRFHETLSEKFPTYGIGMDKAAFREAAAIITKQSDNFETKVKDSFGEKHYTYERIGQELKKWVEIVSEKKQSDEEKQSIYVKDGFLYISMREMKSAVKEWGKDFREFKDYMKMLEVVKVSKGEEKNCRYRTKQDDTWCMTFYIDKLGDIK